MFIGASFLILVPIFNFSPSQPFNFQPLFSTFSTLQPFSAFTFITGYIHCFYPVSYSSNSLTFKTFKPSISPKWPSSETKTPSKGTIEKTSDLSTRRSQRAQSLKLFQFSLGVSNASAFSARSAVKLEDILISL